MRGAWDDGGLVPEGAVMADVEGAITCAFMLPSSGHTRVEPWRQPSLLTFSQKSLSGYTSRSGFPQQLHFEERVQRRLRYEERVPAVKGWCDLDNKMSF